MISRQLFRVNWIILVTKVIDPQRSALRLTVDREVGEQQRSNMHFKGSFNGKVHLRNVSIILKIIQSDPAFWGFVISKGLSKDLLVAEQFKSLFLGR